MGNSFTCVCLFACVMFEPLVMMNESPPGGTTARAHACAPPTTPLLMMNESPPGGATACAHACAPPTTPLLGPLAAPILRPAPSAAACAPPAPAPAHIQCLRPAAGVQGARVALWGQYARPQAHACGRGGHTKYACSHAWSSRRCSLRPPAAATAAGSPSARPRRRI